jgi:hypothetical protein
MVSPLPTLITLAQAKKHLRLTTYEDDDDVLLKLEQATSMVLEYIWRDDDDWVDTMIAWTTTTAPKQIQAAIMVQLGELHRFRGDDVPDQTPKREHGYLSPQVTAYLHRFRDPSVA